MLEAIPESTEEAMASQASKNRKRKKADQSGKGNNRKNRNNLEIIPEEDTFEKEFEREHQEALEAFDAISVAKKHENNPQLANGFTNFSLSPQPSTSHC